MYVEILRSGQNMAENYQYVRSSIEKKKKGNTTEFEMYSVLA